MENSHRFNFSLSAVEGIKTNATVEIIFQILLKPMSDPERKEWVDLRQKLYLEDLLFFVKPAQDQTQESSLQEEWQAELDKVKQRLKSGYQ